MTETSKIYVDIESLLDLRQAILSKLMNPKDLIDFVNTEEYNFRTTDNFAKVDMTKYEENIGQLITLSWCRILQWHHMWHIGRNGVVL